MEIAVGFFVSCSNLVLFFWFAVLHCDVVFVSTSRLCAAVVCVCVNRVLKPQNYVTVSPSRQQVASQAAMESIPLVFEPRSRFYTDPVVVLDFQVS